MASLRSGRAVARCCYHVRVTLEDIALDLRDRVDGIVLSFPVAHVYNPLRYAWGPHREYLRRYGRGRREVLLVGMNPGPWGMAQTGVPFGEVESVRGWLGIEGRVDRPPGEHPKRPVLGFGCRRREVSGRRLWGWAAATFGCPGEFFERFFVANYCPLLLLDAAARNLTPDRLPAAAGRPLLEACDLALRRAVELLRPAVVVGLGSFAARRSEGALAGLPTRVGRALHPSPASPAANRGWEDAFVRDLGSLGVEVTSPPGRGDSR